MKILAYVHLYPPDHNAGAEMYLHEALLGLRRRGHQVQVIADASSAPDFEGVPITTVRSHISGLIADSDIVLTHLDRTGEAMKACKRIGRPLVHLVHNDRQLTRHRVTPASAQLVVANSKWIADAIAWKGRTIVIPPPIDPQRYAVPRGGVGAVTLVNLSEPKGGPLFWDLANRMRDVTFMGVVGGYGKQVIPNRIPANVILIPHSTGIRYVYAQTRILLAPSSYESWGRVGIEAAASGIPTIAHPTPGLLESLAYSGTFADRGDVHAWVHAITRLSAPEKYTLKSAEAKRRSAELTPDPYLRLLESELLATATEWSNR